MASGKLTVSGTKIEVKYVNATGNEVTQTVSRIDLSAPLAAMELPRLEGLEVEFDLLGGSPKKIRASGQAFAAQAPVPASRPQARGPHRPQGGRPQGQHPQAPRDRPPPPAVGEFHNPYNFVPAPPRNGVKNDLGDRLPVGHDRYHDGYYTGTLRVRLTTATPLLLPDAAALTENEDGHKTFPVRLLNGRPHLAVTSVKGMLRAAYEAVTNSRLAVFARHDSELAYRMATNEGLSLVPARVEGDQLVLLPGTSGIGPDRPAGPMYAAWLPRYRQGELDALCYPDGSLPQHRDAVTCWVVRVEHRSGHFSFWGVRQIFRRGQVRGTPDADCRQVDGHVCVTGPNIDRKHDERVFFTDQPDPICIPLGPAERRAWQTLIENYQQEHAEEIRRGRDGPPALQNSRWSRHVAGGSAEAELCDGTLCYATVQKANGRWTLQALYPVMISRRLFEAAPQALLPPKGRPAMALSELSPADRVFGWVNQNGHGAYRGNLRIGPVSCVTADAVTRFDPPGLPLAILGQPKPQQARFYAAASENGEAQAHGLSKSAAGYQKGKGLRGRKVYPHHGVPNSHWANPTEDRTQQAADGLFQEYRRPRLDGREQRDDQNRSLLGWVRPGAEFEFDLHVTNLSRVELGALVWLLALPPQHYHRLGGGKPLGFGSVRLDLLRSDVRTGEQWKEHYASLDGDNPVAQDLRAIQTAFEEAVAEAYGRGKTWREVPFLAAFLRAAAGFADKLPVHYPRKRTAGHAKGPVPPNPQGLSYEWFVANDAVGRHPSGPHYALPDLAADTGLPLLE